MPFYLPGGASSLAILVVALLLDALLGDVRLLDGWPTPGRLVFRTGRWLDRKLNRIERSDAERRHRGQVAAALVIVAAGALGAGVVWLAYTAPRAWNLWIIEAVLLSSCLGLRWAWRRLRAVRQALLAGGLDAGRQAVAPLMRGRAEHLDQHGVARVAVEAAAKALDQRIVAPLFWFALLGLPGALIWTAADALDAAIGHPDPHHAEFGAAAARLDDALNFLPARLSVLLVAIAAFFVPGGKPAQAFATAVRHARLHASRNGGWPIAAFAGALDLALGGPRREVGAIANQAWLGDGRARATAGDLKPAIALYLVAGLLSAALVLSVGLLLAGSWL